MIGPLWGFYQFIRNKGPVPISVDQYFYLVDALHHADFTEVKSPDDLLSLTKIFWLSDENFTERFEHYFFNFFPWEQFFAANENLTQPEEEKTEMEKSVKGDTESEKIDGKENIDSEGEAPNEHLSKSVTSGSSAEALVDFELVLKDSSQSIEDNESFKRNLNHSFILSDLSIMPFDVRNFAQRLRRKVETAEQVVSDIINMPEMVRDYTEKGFLDEIIYRVEDASHSNIVLFSDRFGSMLAYEYLDDHLRAGLRQIPYCQFEHYFFYNLPKLTSDGTHYELRKLGGRTNLMTSDHNWTKKTWFFILSDAGGHSGLVNRERIIATLKFWNYLKNISTNVHWINPIPFEFLNDCSAKRLQLSIPMIYPDQENLNRMIKESKGSN